MLIGSADRSARAMVTFTVSLFKVDRSTVLGITLASDDDKDAPTIVYIAPDGVAFVRRPAQAWCRGSDEALRVPYTSPRAHCTVLCAPS
eukprot:7362068-Prymnesium_polylepis.1